ncbi:CADD family putative folate metabolism protein [Candidatus Mesenet endosymbiont of Agriotes lineatus]|uniref:CADD family putative folate metabolism protein n=1 Tax=Candidatus Mesenet endosymbiont of Agriotes lineatus TaxID=3077948 RepID=UPI0030D01CC0
MSFIDNLNNELAKYSLLNHPFYEQWSTGKLSFSTLQKYAQQYYHHVQAFPCYISAIHSQCNNLKSRQVLLENLIEEERGKENHPELWMRFAESISATRESVLNSTWLGGTSNLVNGYHKLSRDSYAKGLGALYAYERQVPEVAKSKIEGLEKYYKVDNMKDCLKFFEVHITADEWHSEECADLIDELDKKQKNEAHEGATTGAKLLWNFLDGIDSRTPTYSVSL